MEGEGMTKNIFIFDDDADLRRDHAAALKQLLQDNSLFEVKEIGKKDFVAGLETLEKRQEIGRGGRSINLDQSCWFDEAAVLIVESDLVPIRAGVTGEYVAYMARCFSRCGFILGVNQYGPNTFDLTLLGHPESFADLNVGSLQLANAGLWSADWPEFRPWQWPLVPQACQSLEDRVRQLAGNLHRPILEFLQIPNEVAQLFPREVIEFIAPKHPLDDFANVTFEEFLKTSRHGLQPKDADATLPEELHCRVAAARISKWLERLLLAGQELLIDAPHLARRLPSLVKDAELGVTAFNLTACIASIHELNFCKPELVEPFMFKQQAWTSRPAWFWDQLRHSEDILEVSDPWKRQTIDWEFCEDTSQFLSRAECQEFQAKAPAADTRRWIKHVEGVEYVPAVQFAL